MDESYAIRVMSRRRHCCRCGGSSRPAAGPGADGPGRGAAPAGGKTHDGAAAGGRGGPGPQRSAAYGDPVGPGAAVRRGDGLFPLRCRGDPEPGISHRPGRIPGGRVRHRRAAGRNKHQPAGPVVGDHTHWPGAAGAGGCRPAAAVSGRAVLQHGGAVSAGAGENHPAAGSDPGPVRRNGGTAVSPGVRGGRAGGDRRDVPGNPPDDGGAAHRRAGRLPQGGGHPHSAAGGQSPDHRRG